MEQTKHKIEISKEYHKKNSQAKLAHNQAFWIGIKPSPPTVFSLAKAKLQLTNLRIKLNVYKNLQQNNFSLVKTTKVFC